MKSKIIIILCLFIQTSSFGQDKNLAINLDLSKVFFNGIGFSVEYFYKPRISFDLGYDLIKIDRIKSTAFFGSSQEVLNYNTQSIFINYKIYSKRSTHNNGKFGGIYMKFKSTQSDKISQGAKNYWNNFIIGIDRGYKKIFYKKYSFALTIGAGVILFGDTNTEKSSIDPVIFAAPIELFGQVQFGYHL